jgi:hypothetical protein
MFLSKSHFHGIQLVIELFLFLFLDIGRLVDYFVDFPNVTFDLENPFTQTFVILTKLSKEVH